MRTTVLLDDDVFEAAVQIARASGKGLGQVLSELARRGLNASPQPASTTYASGQKRRFAGFGVPADAPLVNAAHLQQLIANEDADG